MTRAIDSEYRDPLDVVWLSAARILGLTVVFTEDAYASTDGKGNLFIGRRETLDADDCLAQMILHELCHRLVEGEDAFSKPDWGLENTTDEHWPREQACLRLQADLLDAHGLRRVLAPTTDHRAFYDALPENPIEGNDVDVIMARRGRARADRPPFRSTLRRALLRTRVIVMASVDASSDVPQRSKGNPKARMLFDQAVAVPNQHSLGSRQAVGKSSGRTCGECAWFFFGGPGPKVGRCHPHDGGRTTKEEAACVRFEAKVACEDCGACCREAYGAVELSRRSPFRRAHPELVEEYNGYLRIRRGEGKCVALSVKQDKNQNQYSCSVYDERPKTCRDFERAGVHCLTARRRVGLSR